MSDTKFISYLRVSTARQGESGLGLEAQRTSIESYLNAGDMGILREFVEVESGKNSERPQLGEALRLCRATGATLLIAKLDRLSRDAHFLLGLKKAGVQFVAVDMPSANELTVGIMALVAQEESKAISIRTKQALAEAKDKGVRLGSPGNLSPEAAQRGRKAGAASIQSRANKFAAETVSHISELLKEGQSLNGIAKTLNDEGILSATGKSNSWTARSVKNIIDRSKVT